MDFVGALRARGGGYNKMEGQAAFFHALHYSVLAHAGRSGNDDEQWLGMMEIEVRFGGGGHRRILPEPF